MWNALHPIVLPAVLLNYVPEGSKNTYLGLLTFIGLILAMFIQPVSGALSDGWRSRFGRRRPLMVIGTVLDFIFLAILAWAGGLTWLIIGYIGLQISSNTPHGPLQGLLPDRVPEHQLGMAAAFKNLMDMLSLIIVSLLAGRLMSAESHDPTLIMVVVILTLAVTGMITIFGTNEDPTNALPGKSWVDFRKEFKIDVRRNAEYWWLIAERAVFLLGIYGVQAFAQYYLQDVLQVADPPKQTGDLLAAITSGLVVLVLVGGWLTDRFGARRILFIASLSAAAGILLMVTATNVRDLTIFGSVLGAGIGLFLTSNWALANRLAPHGESGKFLGLTNLATAGSAALARLEGPVLDLLNTARPGVWLGYKGLFLFGGLCMLASLFFLSKIQLRNS